MGDMNLYKIVADEKYVDYDTYDSAIVAANNEGEARTVTNYEPNGFDIFWTQPVEDLKVVLIGVADTSITKPQVLVASFNAG